MNKRNSNVWSLLISIPLDEARNIFQLFLERHWVLKTHHHKFFGFPLLLSLVQTASRRTISDTNPFCDRLFQSIISLPADSLHVCRKLRSPSLCLLFCINVKDVFEDHFRTSFVLDYAIIGHFDTSSTGHFYLSIINHQIILVRPKIYSSLETSLTRTENHRCVSQYHLSR